MSDPIIITSTDFQVIASKLIQHDVSRLHFTNGIYANPLDEMTPTILAGFEHALDQEFTPDPRNVLAVGVNSDASYALNFGIKIGQHKFELSQLQKALRDGSLSVEKEEQAESRIVSLGHNMDKLEDDFLSRKSPYERCVNATENLAKQNPDRRVFAIPYDAETPRQIYTFMRQASFVLMSLFKFGYGTSPSQGVIVGDDVFDIVFGHPYPNGGKAFCDDTTPIGDHKNVIVRDLRLPLGMKSKAYINSANECLFECRHPDLQKYFKQSRTVVVGQQFVSG
ncbi:MAG: hypothetical protein PHD48_08860 [Alphaproteobacteria bacterium]|nr:hypothetical protein [Alphaproteobacteria bacterium]